MMVKKLRLWAGYMEEPVSVHDSEIFRHCDVDDLAISDCLKPQLQAWDDEYQGTFDQNDPMGSDFLSTESAVLHAQKGAELAKRLQRELGDEYAVEYKT